MGREHASSISGQVFVVVQQILEIFFKITRFT